VVSGAHARQSSSLQARDQAGFMMQKAKELPNALGLGGGKAAAKY
jgi:hypothetical protein